MADYPPYVPGSDPNAWARSLDSQAFLAAVTDLEAAFMQSQRGRQQG
jgi:hypothetical protein